MTSAGRQLLHESGPSTRSLPMIGGASIDFWSRKTIRPCQTAGRTDMRRIFHRALLLQPLLFAAALPAVMLAEGAAPALAGSVTVTGANGANGAPGQPGGAGGSATATATSS